MPGIEGGNRMSRATKLDKRKHALRALTSRFCEEFLDEEYAELSARVIDDIARRAPILLVRGKVEIWAAPVVYALGQINALFNERYQPSLSRDELCDSFGTKRRTTSQKAKRISDLLDMELFHPDYSTADAHQRQPLEAFGLLFRELWAGRSDERTERLLSLYFTKKDGGCDRGAVPKRAIDAEGAEEGEETEKHDERGNGQIEKDSDNNSGIKGGINSNSRIGAEIDIDIDLDLDLDPAQRTLFSFTDDNDNGNDNDKREDDNDKERRTAVKEP